MTASCSCLICQSELANTQSFCPAYLKDFEDTYVVVKSEAFGNLMANTMIKCSSVGPSRRRSFALNLSAERPPPFAGSHMRQPRSELALAGPFEKKAEAAGPSRPPCTIHVFCTLLIPKMYLIIHSILVEKHCDASSHQK